MWLLCNESSVGGGDNKGVEPFDLFRLPADEFAQALTAEDAVSASWLTWWRVELWAGGQRGEGRIHSLPEFRVANKIGEIVSVGCHVFPLRTPQNICNNITMVTAAMWQVVAA